MKRAKKTEFTCFACERIFDTARGLTQHRKYCKKLKENNSMKNKKRRFIEKNVSLTQSSPASDKNESDNSCNHNTFPNDHDNSIDNDNTDAAVPFTKFTESQRALLIQQQLFNNNNDRGGHFLWDMNELSKLSLLKILHRHKCHNNAFEDIMKWACYYSNVPQSDIFKHANNVSRRDTFVKHVSKRRDMLGTSPRKEKIVFDEDISIEVTTYDFKQQLLSLLRDNELMNPKNLVLREPSTVQSTTNSTYISEINYDSEWYQSAYRYFNSKLGVDRNRVICGIILTVDKTHTDWKGKLCLEPVHFTLSIFNTETRKRKYSAWRCLGFINDLDTYSGSKIFADNVSYFQDDTTVSNNSKSTAGNLSRGVKRKMKYSEKKSLVYHDILEKILSSLKTVQDENGLVWDMRFPSGKIHRVHMVFPICLCVVDMKGARQLCGMYDTSSNIQRPCVSCTTSYSDLDKIEKVCVPVLERNMKELIIRRNEDELKEVSQHPNIRNVFFNLCTGGWKYGIWGLCPTEVLHQFYEGVLTYALEEFYGQFLTPKYRYNLTVHMRSIIQAISNQSDKNLYPSGTFTLGITKFKSMKGVEKFGAIFYLSLFLHTKVSQTMYFEGLLPMEARMKRTLMNWRTLFETSLFYHDWLMSKSFERSSLHTQHSKIINLYKLFQKLVIRDGAGISTIPKFHEFFHITRNIIWHGPSIGYDTKPTESNLRTSKALALNTRQQVSSLPFETGKRLYEFNVMSSTFSHIESNCSKETNFLFDPSRYASKSTDDKDTTSRRKMIIEGLFYSVYNIISKEVGLYYDRKCTKPIKNNCVEFQKLCQFMKERIFSLLKKDSINDAKIILPCYTNLIRKSISFRAISREQYNYPSWATFQWIMGNNETSHVPGKIITFIDFSSAIFKEEFVDLYPISEIHVVIESLISSIDETSSSSSNHICGIGTIQNVEYSYHCVSANTISDTAFVIPDFGNNNDRKVLVVFPRKYDDDNVSLIDEKDVFSIGWRSKF